jgi:hypothetical protein
LGKFGRSSKPKDEDDYREVARRRGIVWAEGVLPKNTKTKTLWRCDQHDPPFFWWACYGNVRTRSSCPECAGVTPKTDVDYHALAALSGIAWTGVQLPENTDTATSWTCSQHAVAHTWQTTYGCIRHGTGCPLCVCAVPKTAADYHALAAAHEIVWVGASLPQGVLQTTDWRCDKHQPPHTWKARYASIQQGSGCPECVGKRPRTREDYLAAASVRGIVWVAESIPDNAHTSTRWRCDKHEPPHCWNASYTNVFNGGTGCPVCSRARQGRRSKAGG